MIRPRVSIIIPTLNEGHNVLDTVDSVLRNSPTGLAELIVVDDGSTDHSLRQLRQWDSAGRIRLLKVARIGPARCRNHGARAVQSELIAFLDAHCFVPPGWLAPLLDAMDQDPGLGVVGPIIAHTGDFRMRGFGGTWHDDSLDMSWLSAVQEVTEVPFQPAGCQLVRRRLFEQVGGYDDGLMRWGSEDVEFCIRVWLFGHRICVHPASTVYHLFREQPPYKVDLAQIVYNKLRLIFSHFEGNRLHRVLRHQLRYPHAAEALARLYTDGTHRRRQQLLHERKRDMDWFCDRFGLVC